MKASLAAAFVVDTLPLSRAMALASLFAKQSLHRKGREEDDATVAVRGFDSEVTL